MSELLELLAQLAITIAALSAVAGAASTRKYEQNYALRDVALIGLAVALYSFIPLLMVEAEIPIDLALRVAAGFAGLSWFVGYLLYLKRIWRDKDHFTGMFYIGAALTFIGLMFFGNTIHVGSSVTYLSGLLCWLAIASINFIDGVFARQSGGT